MTKSAIAPRGDRRTTIISCAQQLAVKCGYSGFTFDDLAQAVGVSRRTLFNHVASKEEAVLGVLPVITEEQSRTLREGGPTGDLLEDLVRTVIECLDADSGTVEDWQGMHAVMLRNPELLGRVQTHVDELVTDLVADLVHRDGVDQDRARVAVSVVGGIAGRAVHDCIEDPDLGPLDVRIRHNLALAQEFLTAAR